MDCKLLGILTILSIMLLLPDDSVAWPRWRRRWFRFRTCKVVLCTPTCHKVDCDKRTLNNDEPEAKISSDFTKYDADSDGFITKDEWGSYWDADAKDVDEVYDRADTNGDGKLSPDEFSKGPFGFENDDSEQTNA